VIVAVTLLGIVLEHWMPHARQWSEDRGDTRTDLVHYLVNVATSQIASVLYVAVTPLTGGGLRLWPASLPFAMQWFLGLLVFDLGLYVMHRASHTVPWLWRFHAIHHSAPRLYWLNGQRRHVFHEMIEGLPALVVLAIVGAPTTVVACATATITIHLVFQHANIEQRAGFLRYVFSVAELHRWHHQRRYEDVQGNYGAFLAIWDRLFGTALDAKKGDAPLDVGMDDEPTLPADWRGQLVWPFKRRS
jgi:sterol desaturase/sphingolipid hydroxylase (fatty acid hydroxylase superfamily)